MQDNLVFYSCEVILILYRSKLAGIGSRKKMADVLDLAKYGNTFPCYGREVDTSQNQSQLFSDNAVRSISVVSIFIASYYFQIYNNIFCKEAWVILNFLLK